MIAPSSWRRCLKGSGTLALSLVATHALAASPDHAFLQGHCGAADTQYDLNQCAGKAAEAVDRELNATYQAVLRKWQHYPAVVAKLRASQRAWLAYRDADVESRFAYETLDASHRGTILPFAELVYRAGLEQERTERLCVYLRGLAEGEVERASCTELVASPRIVPAPTH